MPQDSKSVRAYVADVAESVAGLGYGHGRDLYLDLLASPNDSPMTKESEGHLWSCALTVRGIMRKLGVEHREIDRPYTFTGPHSCDAMTRLETIGVDFKALIEAGSPMLLPSCGDFVMVKQGFHVLTFTTSPTRGDDGVTRVDTVEGGQKDAGGMCIQSFAGKILHVERGQLFLSGSPIWKWIDCTRLGIVVPGDTTPDRVFGGSVIDLPSEHLGDPSDDGESGAA